MKVVVDHFNEVASLAKFWNKKVDQYKKIPQGEINKEQYDQYEKDFKLRAKDNIKLLKNVKYLSNVTPPSYILNSSMSIQRELLDSKKGKQPQKVYFNIQNQHGDFKIQEIRYLQGLKESFIDFLHNFWFEIERKLKIRNNDNTAIKEMKKQFLEEVKDKHVNYCSRFLYVRQYLTQTRIQELQKNYDQLKRKNRSQNPFKGIYESFTEENTVKYKEQLRRYFQTDKTNRSLSLFYALYDIALLQSNTTDKDKGLTVKLNDLARRMGMDPVEQLKLDKYKEILPFTLSQGKDSIEFYWKPEQFISTTKDVIFKIQAKQDSSLELITFQTYPTFRDIAWKISLIQLLKKGADATFRRPKTKQLQELRFNIEHNRFTTFQSFNQFIITPKSKDKSDKRLSKENMLQEQQAIAYIKKVLYENPKSEKYPEQLETYEVHKVATASIGKNLKDLFAKCDQYPGEYCIATPSKKSDYEFIDFIITKKQLGKYHIFTFDASILKKKARIQDAKALFAELISRQAGKPNYMISHIALCHKDAEQSLPYDLSKTFNIFYSPWDEIVIGSAIDQLALKSFCKLRDINNAMDEKLKKTEETEE